LRIYVLPTTIFVSGSCIGNPLYLHANKDFRGRGGVLPHSDMVPFRNEDLLSEPAAKAAGPDLVR
jgi:hypothetical protein